LLWLAACATPPPQSQTAAEPPKKTPLRFHLASVVAQEGYRETRDEVGQPLFVAHEPFLTEQDVRGARLLKSQRRDIIVLEFNGYGADRLDRVTTDHVGQRLAVYVDDQLLLSPVIRTPMRNGQAALDGDFTPAHAARIVASLNPPPTNAGGPRR
jgi:preprotein translocase subunit SecD